MHNPEQSNDIRERFYLASSFFDQQLYDLNVVSFIKLIVYLPFGLLLMLLRSVIFILLNASVNIMPSLQYNNVYIRCVSLTLGLYAQKNPNNKTIRNNKLKIYASNHVTCLDYIAIKSIVNECNYEETLNRTVTNEIKSNWFSMLFTRILQANHEKSNKSAIYFPEQIATNGSGLLKFDSRPFDLLNESNQDMSYSCVPVCIRVNRPFLPFKLNYINSNDAVNVFITLFVPITIYDVKFLPEEFKHENETSERFAVRIRKSIGNYLHLNCSELSYENLKQIFANYKEYVMQQHQLRRLAHEAQTRQRENSVSFTDISRVALQIKDILPDVSFETIKQHINSSASLDIDTVIASILDSNESNTSVNQQATSVNAIPIISNKIEQKQPIKQVKNSLTSYKSYEERKFELLNEARQRYLSKHKI